MCESLNPAQTKRPPRSTDSLSCPAKFRASSYEKRGRATPEFASLSSGNLPQKPIAPTLFSSESAQPVRLHPNTARAAAQTRCFGGVPFRSGVFGRQASPGATHAFRASIVWYSIKAYHSPRICLCQRPFEKICKMPARPCRMRGRKGQRTSGKCKKRALPERKDPCGKLIPAAGRARCTDRAAACPRRCRGSRTSARPRSAPSGTR